MTGQTASQQDEIPRWEYMFGLLGCSGVKVTKLIYERNGRILQLMLPRTGDITISSLREILPRVEVILRLPSGAVDLEEAEHAGDIRMTLHERQAPNA
jgi:hypothetical protein